MTFKTWREAVAFIRETCANATDKQFRLAELAGIRLPQQLPRLVASAQLKTALRFELDLSTSAQPLYSQLDYLTSLGVDSGYRIEPPADQLEVDAWVLFLRLRARQQALEKTEVNAGDIVEVRGSEGSMIAEVSSIGGNGRIYLKGGLGAGAWPDNIIIQCRRTDNTTAAQDLRRRAASQAANRSKLTHWSESKERLLADFRVRTGLTTEAIERLHEVVDSAADEKPIQQFIESNPQLLTALLGGRNRYCVPQQRLVDKYTADFFISDVDSGGIRWILVELETPRSSITLETGRDLDRYARKGVSQVREWREWLQENLDKARSARHEDGLGLVDIRPHSDGLVLVGRRERLNDSAKEVRNSIWEDNKIRVRTYDWLLERLYGCLYYDGIPELNPNILSNRSNTDEDL